MRTYSSFRITIALIALLNVVGRADDWPQWRGLQRDAVSNETGLLQSWPEGGPKLAWKLSGLGTGYSSVSIGCGRLFTLGRHDADVVVTAIDLVTRKPVWKKKIGETTRNPSSTPTLDGDRVYALDPDGDLVCLKAETGEVLWQKSFVEDFSGRMMSARGNGESPLVDGERLVCTPGGIDAAMVALDKFSGKVIWKAKIPELGPLGKYGAGFSSIVVTEAAGVRQYVQLMGRGLIGIDANDGRFLWGYNAIANNEANIPTPIVHEDFVFAANGYTAGCVLLKLVADKCEDTPLQCIKPEVVFSLTGSQFQNHHGGMVRIGDFLFSGHGNNNGLPTCLEFRTGRVIWKRRGPGVGSAAVIFADGNLIFRYQDGVVALIEATDRGYNLKGTFDVPGNGGDSWAHPVIADRHLYLREQDILWVYDLRRETESTLSDATTKSMSEGNSAATRLRNLGVTIELLNDQTVIQGSFKGSEKSLRTYKYALVTNAEKQTESAFIVTIAESQVSQTGTLSDELLNLLKSLPEPLVINLAGTSVSDGGLEQLQRLNLAGINLELCGRVTDAGLQYLKPVKSLRVLILTATRVTRVGLEHLVSNPNLLGLDLELCDGVKDDACQTIGLMKQLRLLVLKKSGFERPGITNVGLQELQGLSNLEVLNLYGNSLTNDGLTKLQSLAKLRVLNLSLLDISDVGLQHLKPLTSLEQLDLLYTEGFAGPELTDGAVEFLKPLAGLSTLNLTGSQLTDVGLKRLEMLKNLKILQLVRTKVTLDGVQSFQMAVPGCEIIK